MLVQEPPHQHRQITPEQWNALAAEPEFRALVRARRTFIVPATLFFLAFYLALPISIWLAPDVMSRPVGHLTWAYVFAFAQIIMGWLLLAFYLLRSKGFDLQAARCRKHETEEIKG